MEGASYPALRCAENLTLPRVQVIVMSANMGCCHCRQRVSRIISKINGLLDYVVDVRNKEVIVRGAIDSKQGPVHSNKTKLLDGAGFSDDVRLPHKSTRFFSAFKDMCSTSCFCTVKTT